MGGDLTLRERLFVAIAWLPKATVQAAIGGIALDNAKNLPEDHESREEYERLGSMILTIAVLVILITAPIGAIGIMLSGPKLLKREEENEGEGHEDP